MKTLGRKPTTETMLQKQIIEIEKTIKRLEQESEEKNKVLNNAKITIELIRAESILSFECTRKLFESYKEEIDSLRDYVESIYKLVDLLSNPNSEYITTPDADKSKKTQ